MFAKLPVIAATEQRAGEEGDWRLLQAAGLSREAAAVRQPAMKSIRTPRLVVGLCLLALLLAACTPRQPYSLPARPDIPFGQGRLWQIEGQGIETGYVFATLPIGDTRLLKLPDWAETALAEARIAIFDGLGDALPGKAYADLESVKLAGDETLEDLIGSRSFGTLTWLMKRDQLRPKNNIKPWLFWLYMDGANWGFVDYDTHYHHWAERTQNVWLESWVRRNGRRVVGLESQQERFDLYNNLPLDTQVHMLKLSLDRYSESAPGVPKVQLYLDGDLATLDALWREYLSWLPPEAERVLDTRLVTDRNKLMVERMIPLLEQDTAFVAIGALHLPGEQGILRLLEQRGYTVTRLQ